MSIITWFRKRRHEKLRTEETKLVAKINTIDKFLKTYNLSHLSHYHGIDLSTLVNMQGRLAIIRRQADILEGQIWGKL
jgi:type II secretory pathway component PulF